MGRTSPRGATLRSLRRFLPDVPPREVAGQPTAVTEPTDLERAFAAAWFALGGTPVAWDETMEQPRCLRWQVRFDPTRRFRADFGIVAARVLIDLQGGSHDGHGWHQQRDRYQQDAEKLNRAAEMGFRMFWLTGAMVSDEPAKHIGPIIRLVRADGDRGV